MSFYANISKYYEYIFPVREPQKKFFQNQLQNLPNKKILDIACGTGAHTIELNNAGYQVIGIDLDQEVIKKAQKIADSKGLKINFQVANMLDLPFANGEFGGVFCIGNSLVHLLTEAEILKALKEMYRVLDEDGVVILQIVNYDRILDNKLTGLPPIENQQVGLSFARNYVYRDDGLIDFNTTLKVSEGEFHNSVKLLPLRQNELEKLAVKAGFKDLKFYGNFLQEEYNKDSFATIVVANK